MKKKRYLQTNFVKFLIESERQSQKELEDEIQKEIQDEDEIQIEDEIQDEDEFDSDKIIERLIQRRKKLSKEYDNIMQGRKRK